jgi:cellulose synthase/poly-beta-1,6-N-acetylglucosamine synthase-like glycosyltransferase
MSAANALSTAVVIAVAYLLLAYAVGGPLVLARTLVQALRNRRRRYRAVPDDVLATSRFTIPASVVLPTGGAMVADAVDDLLRLNYPEFELIVVHDGSPDAMADLRERFALSACEVFYRRTLPTSPVRGIYRSTRDARLLVVDAPGGSHGDALNCGVNLARFRYICCVDASARYHRDALLDAMRAAVEDPALVIGVTTALGPAPLDPQADDHGPGLAGILQKLAALRALLARNIQRRLGLATDVQPGFTLWRRDVVVDGGGFSSKEGAEHLEMTFRAHRRLARAGTAYTIVHVNAPVGHACSAPSLAALVAARRSRQRAMVRILWDYRGMLFNPRYRRVGMLHLPRYLFTVVIVPWLELASLLVLPFAAAAGVLTAGQLGLVAAAVAGGNGVLLNTAMLIAPRPASQAMELRLLLLAPFEVFLWRPMQLYSKLVALLRTVVPRRAATTAADLRT